MELKSYLKVLVLLLTVFAVVILAGGIHAESDPRGSLLVSQSIFKHGTIKLDTYREKIFNRYRCVTTDHEGWYECVIYKKNGHYYYYFPLGTSIISVPFVAIFNMAGLDITDYVGVISYEVYLQIIISALGSSFTFLFLFLLARLYLDQNNSLLISAITWFGSSFASTTATALWSHNFATLFALVAIYFSARSVKLQNYKIWPVIAVSLFLSYFCRPTLMILMPFLIAYIFLSNKRIAIFIGLLFAFFVMGFIVFSYYEFKQILPDYYYPKRVLSENNSFIALFGNLLSPSRGFLVFSPILLLPLIYFRKIHSSLKQEKALALLLIWPVIHWIVISRFGHWWAGWSYGPRLMTDVLPGIYLLLVLTVKNIDFSKLLQLGTFVALGMLSIYINTFQGLFNEYAQRWNAEPNIDQYPEYLFDWRYPQFLHNKARHEARLKEFGERRAMAPPGG